MPTVIEHHGHDTGDSASSAVTMIVAVFAIIVLLGIVLFAFRVFPFNAAGTPDNTLDVNIEGTLPTGTPQEGAGPAY